ncbi:MAG: N-acetylneuraminate synthase [Bacteroidetes bacterium]|nr:N-acetylneuraminate synthase [Bacteroidota bacterium]
MRKTLIIAEAGVNHNGNIEMAKQLIEAAADAGVDYVKFQTFKTEKLVSVATKQAEYQQKNIGKKGDSQFEMLKKLELSIDDHHQLIAHCKLHTIKFLSTAFDLDSIDLLHNLGIDLFKIPSGEVTNLPYLKKIGSFNKKVILSTGMCVMQEIKDAVNALVNAGTERSNISVLHCTTDYPTAMVDVNLNAMLSIKEHLHLPIGYSDHTLGIEVPIAAVAMGATIIEKHFTLDKTLPKPDHKASLEPEELKAMVTAIRNVEKAFGVAEKQPTTAEIKNMLVARKSIHLQHPLSQNHVVEEIDLVMKRPGDGISPMLFDQIIGKKLKQDFEAEHKLRWEDLE